jgi:hypothetical protein
MALRAERLSEDVAPLACRKRAAALLRGKTVQLKFDLAWIPGGEPTVSLEGIRVELVRLMAAAIVATRVAIKEEDDDERSTPEDRK